MADKEEDVIEIIEDGAAAEITKVETPVVTAEEGQQELKRRLDEATANAARERAARVASDEAAKKAIDAKDDGELREISTGLDVAKRNQELAKQQFKAARTAGDVDAEADAMEAMAQAKADINALEAGKAAREFAKKNPPAPQQTQQQDPVEALAADIGQRFPRSGQWVRDHADIVRTNWPAVRAASDLAIASGMTAETDAYFEHIQGTLTANRIMKTTEGTRQANGNGNGTHIEVQTETPMSDAAKPVAPAAAPVSRSGAAPGQQRPGTMRLSRDEADMAEMTYAHLVKKEGKGAAHKAYALEKIRLKNEGKLQ
jgi:hypothetical protein